MLLPAKTRITRPSRLKAKKSPGNKLRTQSSKTTAKRAGATKYGNFASRLLEALDPSRVKWAAFVTTTRPPADYIVSTSAKIERVDVTFSESAGGSAFRAAVVVFAEIVAAGPAMAVEPARAGPPQRGDRPHRQPGR